MCGIAGRVGPLQNGPEDMIGLVQAMAERLAHRGPDGAGVWAAEDGSVALAHRRLAIIDLSPAGAQPMHDARGRFTIVFNGEIYNYRELRRALEGAGAVFRGHSDTEVLLELYAREGAACLPRLDGIFAFAIWDGHRRELFLARDALGVKPLYFAEDSQGVAFASELKALLPALRHKALDALALHRYMTYLWCPGDGTPLREVRRLGPGEAMIVQEGRIHKRWRWYRPPAQRTPAVQFATRQEAIAATASGLRCAVHRQLVADVPVGAFLSGGLDSSAVVAFAREQVPGMRCFTIALTSGNDPGFVDDLPYARQVAAHLGVPLDAVRVDGGRMAGDLERMVWMLDEPLADPAPLNVFYISQLAREQGVKVLLSGAGGDDLFSGYRRHLALHLEGWWSWLPPTLRKSLSYRLRRGSAASPLGRRLQRLAHTIGVADDKSRLAAYFAWVDGEALWRLYSPAMRELIASQRADQPLIDFLDEVDPAVAPLERMLALEQRFFLADHNLLYTDKMSMAAGVEVRVPFLDKALVETAARIPVRFKQNGRTSKWVLKQAMAPYLPGEIIHRPKTGFGAPLRRWLRNEVRPLADELLSPTTLRSRGLFDPDAVTALRAADAEGRVDAAYTLFGLMCIELWCRRFVDSTH